jgi:beta-galactosidase
MMLLQFRRCQFWRIFAIVFLSFIVCSKSRSVSEYQYFSEQPRSLSNRSFVISGNDFVKDGHPFRILSGSFHYFRSLPELWKDRLLKMKAGGLNTVETYIPWNLHQPRNQPVYNFAGRLDVVRFIRLAQEVGLLVIIRGPPYICAEWEFGGFPSWLLKDKDVQMRCSNPKYLFYVTQFLRVLLPKLVPLQYVYGGPIILFQIENEYGSYGSDHEYLRTLYQTFRNTGIVMPIFCSNGPGDLTLQGGAIPEVLRTVNFGIFTNVDWNFNKLRQYQPTGPLMCTEYWDGWFDNWGGCHAHADSIALVNTLLQILSWNASVNLYMYHGGTTFGFMNGANADESGWYAPQVTSYDYDAPISESGDLTFNYYLLREIFSTFYNNSLPEPPSPSRKLAYGLVHLTVVGTIFDDWILSALSKNPVESVTPLTMEDMDQDYGFVLYRTKLDIGPIKTTLYIPQVRDRAQVFLNRTYMGTVWRADAKTNQIPLTLNSSNMILDILVENTGRINFGSLMALEKKGLPQGINLDGQYQYHWENFPLPLDDISPISQWNEKSKYCNQGSPCILTITEGKTKMNEKKTVFLQTTDNLMMPTFYKGYFNITEVADTWIAVTRSFTKGVVWINRFNLGRYWDIGPQQNLYIPAPLLKRGVNELVIFELYQFKNAHIPPFVELVGNPDLGRNC